MPLRIEQAEVQRDKWGRPMIGGRTYTRATTLAGSLDDKSGLVRWARKDAVARIMEDPTLLNMGEVDRVAEATQERGSSGYGTDVHGVIESLLLDGTVPNGATPEQVADAEAALDFLDSLGLRAIASEVFVVNEDLESAGTLDLLAEDSGGQCVIVDWKTTAKPAGWRYRHLSWAGQLATYANGRPIDAEGSVTTWESLGLKPPVVDEGLIVQIHARHATAQGFWVDLKTGLELAQLAYDLTHARKIKTLQAVV